MLSERSAGRRGCKARPDLIFFLWARLFSLHNTATSFFLFSFLSQCHPDYVGLRCCTLGNPSCFLIFTIILQYQLLLQLTQIGVKRILKEFLPLLLENYVPPSRLGQTYIWTPVKFVSRFLFNLGNVLSYVHIQLCNTHSSFHWKVYINMRFGLLRSKLLRSHRATQVFKNFHATTYIES